ncbi:hypothetical protein N825_13960 [Skermanella stibiiresistens SB22]|uniref:Uncharacterized protein n=1 Tax=Skermanella stibiiresistens SB22 TaxID=1385369 RepID=W9GWY0_9PROT|nr:hypothetical protein N825_13960 [Skermanella stibiiresistens SB22]
MGDFLSKRTDNSGGRGQANIQAAAATVRLRSLMIHHIYLDNVYRDN